MPWLLACWSTKIPVLPSETWLFRKVPRLTQSHMRTASPPYGYSLHEKEFPSAESVPPMSTETGTDPTPAPHPSANKPTQLPVTTLAVMRRLHPLEMGMVDVPAMTPVW